MGVSEKEISVLRLIDAESQREVLDKLVRLETKMDTLVGAEQPGRMKIAEDTIAPLERNDVRSSVYNRVLDAGLSAVVSIAIALHKFWWKWKIWGGEMIFLSQLLRGIAFVPALVNGIEGLFGGKSGAEKKDAAMSFLESAMAIVDAVAAREIVEPVKFREGISKIIDGTVECLNASTCAKGGSQP
jgi:hypothetical protein